MRHFDLCIIGTGSGNSIIDERFDHLSVALVEMGTFGGTCLNVGCIPSKMFVYPADLAAFSSVNIRPGIPPSSALRCTHLNNAKRKGIWIPRH